MRNQVKSSLTANNSTRTASTKTTLRDYIVCVGILTLFLTGINCEAAEPFYTFLGYAISSALIYVGKGYKFQNESNF